MLVNGRLRTCCGVIRQEGSRCSIAFTIFIKLIRSATSGETSSKYFDVMGQIWNIEEKRPQGSDQSCSQSWLFFMCVSVLQCYLHAVSHPESLSSRSSRMMRHHLCMESAQTALHIESLFRVTSCGQQTCYSEDRWSIGELLGTFRLHKLVLRSLLK